MSPRRRATVRTGRAPAPQEAASRGLADPRALKQLTLLMEETGLVELEIESGGEKVRLVRARAAGGTVEAERVPLPPRAARREVDAEDGAARTITSPMVGTFHRSSAPEVPPLVEVGDVVDRGQVVCLVEAMKMMNEIEAEFRGRIVKILVENGRPIEYGEPLFLVEPV